jgi:tetratricopeptide (TPR) repeat protein
VKATKAACAEAVALIQDKLGPTAPPVLSKHLTDEQKRRCSAICYELLLVWADAEAQPEPGAKKPTQSQLETALKLMDRAVAPDSKPTRSYHLRRAAYLELLPNADEALREQQLASATPPQGALDYFLMGTTHQRTSGQLAEAAADFAKALQAEPDHFWARYFLGVCNLRQQPPQLEQARDNFTACLVAQPDFPWLYLFRGFAHGLLNEYQAAEDDHRRALALSPDPQAVYSILVNQGVLCMRQARQAAGTAPFRLSDPFTPNLNLAVAAVADAFRRDRLLAAAGYLNKAAAQNPRQYLAYHYLALLAQEQKQLPEALQLLDKAIKEAEDREPSIRAQLFGQRARVHQERKDLDAALEDLKCSLEILPGAADQMERGRILLARQRYLDAIAAFEDVHRLRPSEADAYRWKAEALRAMHLDKEAAQALDQYLAKGGRPTADFYRTRGQVRVQLRQLPPALADYTQSLTLQPDARTYTARGWVFLANEVLPLALQDFEEALRSDPENGEAYAGRGLVRVRMGQYEQGLADAEAAVNQGRHESSRLFWNTAHVYAQMMSRLAVEPGAQNARIGLTKARCFDRALEMLRRALDQVPAGERARFWRQYVAKDALLNPIRGTPGFDRLEREYGQ